MICFLLYLFSASKWDLKEGFGRAVKGVDDEKLFKEELLPKSLNEVSSTLLV